MTSPVARMAWSLAALLCLAPSLTAPTRVIRIGAIFTEDQKVSCLHVVNTEHLKSYLLQK